MQMININSTNTILYCTNWEAMVDFYKTKLKFNILIDKGWFIEFRLNDFSKLSIADETRTSIKCGNGKGITITFEVNNLKEIHSSLLESGLSPLQIKDHPWDAKIFHIFDPDGNRLEFWSPNVG